MAWITHTGWVHQCGNGKWSLMRQHDCAKLRVWCATVHFRWAWYFLMQKMFSVNSCWRRVLGTGFIAIEDRLSGFGPFWKCRSLHQLVFPSSLILTIEAGPLWRTRRIRLSLPTNSHMDSRWIDRITKLPVVTYHCRRCWIGQKHLRSTTSCESGWISADTNCHLINYVANIVGPLHFRQYISGIFDSLVFYNVARKNKNLSLYEIKVFDKRYPKEELPKK